VNAELAFALELADLADGMTMSGLNAGRLDVQRKPDGSPVTQVDREVERALRTRIREAYPSHAVVGEEYGRQGDSDWRWYLDPIDGTASFIDREKTWGTLIALAHGQDVILGVTSMPSRAHRWWAYRGRGAFCDGRPLRVSDVPRLAEATVYDNWRNAIDRAEPGHPLVALRGRCGQVVLNDGHPFLSVAEGHADVAATTGGGPWDYAALVAIVEEAGGRVTDLQGRPRFDGGACLASNGLLHEEALEALRE
jgi:histidinol-phosphatase